MDSHRSQSRHRVDFAVILLLMVICWLLFVAGCLWQHFSKPLLDSPLAVLAVGMPGLAIGLGALLWSRSRRLRQWVNEELERHTATIEKYSSSGRLWAWIALAAALSLFAELLIIRLHSSFFQLFAYFKNVSLLSCFLGLGIGYARGARRPLLTPLVIPALGLQIVLLQLLRFTPVRENLQNPIAEQLTLGLDQAAGLGHVITVYGLLGLVFVLNALCMVPVGQLASTLMMQTHKLVAYSWNLLGSLAGIVLFTVISFLWMPPPVWIAVTALITLVFLRRTTRSLIWTVAAALLVVVVLTLPTASNEHHVYSPYQILTLRQTEGQPPQLRTSNAYYQRILDLREETVQTDPTLRRWANYYALPYLFKPNPADVLIVGSGAGNDVAAALRHGAAQVDAVEIDPAILDFGRRLHPEAPYASGQVTAIVDDARAYLRHTERTYDLIVYGLLDSHSLLSGKSGGVRLDSFVYTVEAFREARRRLKEDGLICLTFCIMREELGRRLFFMLTEAFDGIQPLVYQVGYDGGYTFVIGETVHQNVFLPPPGIHRVSGPLASRIAVTDLSTDDWPFFYMPKRTYPTTYVIVVAVLIAVSALLIWRLIPMAGSGFSVSCFFLGAGFMLIETKGITELALVWGSTWMVVSIVIAAILVMAYLANLLIMRIGNVPPIVAYGLLWITILAGGSLSFLDSSAWPQWLQRGGMTILLTLPLFFSGFAFSSELRKSRSVAIALSSNLLGAILGGFAEYNSMYFGFQSLYVMALIMYVLAFVGSVRAKG